MNNEEKKLLGDILTSIESIDIHLQGQRNFKLYQQNITMRRSVEREIEIIGEAMRNLTKIYPDVSITSKRKIIDLRNLVIHAYGSIENETIWAVVINNIPLLKSEVEALLNNQ